MNCIDCVIIPARGGSKRILRKNLAHFLGVPMLERSIKLAKMVSKCVVVSSDDSEILEVAKNLGVYGIRRDEKLANDFTPTIPVIIHALLPFLQEEVQQKYKKKDFSNEWLDNVSLYDSEIFYDEAQVVKPSFNLTTESSVLCLYPTAVFAKENSLLQTYDMLCKNKNAAYIVSIVSQAKVFRSFTCNQEGYLQFIFPEFMQTRSQDLPESFCDAGQFYLGYARSFLEQIPILGAQSMGLALDCAWDIDTPSDLLIAQTLFTHENKE